MPIYTMKTIHVIIEAMRIFVKKIILLFYVFFLAIITVLLALFLIGPFIDVSYRAPLELGEEVVATFPRWIPGSIAKYSLQVNPSIKGELVWLAKERELHFIPDNGFDPTVAYKATIGFGSPFLAQLTLPTTTLTFQSPFAPTPSKTARVYQPSMEKGKFIDINLETMRMTLFEDGKAIKTYPVAAKGNPRSAPTREGNFTILTKEEKHLASREHLWMPWSMQFSGDYFIHGWPYWPNGERLKSKYSAGCIRLQVPDAKEVYEWADRGTALAVHSTSAHLFFATENLQDGDLVREIGDYRVYVIKKINEKSFKRHVVTERFAEWYTHLAPFSAKLKILEPNALSSYALSRWIRAKDDSYVYEIDDAGVKHQIRCDLPSDCLAQWETNGWDADEIFIVSPEELAFYERGTDKELKPFSR